MATITLNYDSQNNLASKTIDYILSLGVFRVEEKQKKMTGIDVALQEIKKGKVTRLKNIKNPMEEILQ